MRGSRGVELHRGDSAALRTTTWQHAPGGDLRIRARRATMGLAETTIATVALTVVWPTRRARKGTSEPFKAEAVLGRQTLTSCGRGLCGKGMSERRLSFAARLHISRP